MLNKFLLIGVGGSGGKTLRYTWHELERRLAGTQWTHGVPDAWQFLHIDVAEHVDVVEHDVPVSIGSAARYLGLAREPHRYPYYDAGVMNHGPLSAYGGWRVDPKLPLRPPSRGAGQRRVVGRVLTIHEINRVGQAIDDAVNRLMDPAVGHQLDALNQTLDATELDNAHTPTVVVVSSMGGGSGSGAFLDVIELIKRKAIAPNEWLESNLVTLLFSADTFMHLKAEKKRGVEANSMAALSEFMAAFDHEDDVAGEEDQFIARGGGALPIEGRRTGDVNLLVGAGNRHVSFTNGHDVYRAVGKAFAAFISNEAVQREFHVYLPNANGADCATTFNVADSSAAFRHFSSLGYSNVSLGRALLAQYAEERFAKLAIERLLRGHREGVEDVETRDNEALIAEATRGVRTEFFENSGLWELNEDHNQVLDKLRDIETKRKRLNDLAEGVIAKYRKGRNANAGEWLRTLTGDFDSGAAKLMAWETEDRHERAKQWVPEVQAKLVAATSQAVSRYGAPVGLRLLLELDDQVEQAARQLVQAGVSYDEEKDGLLQGIVRGFRGVLDEALNGRDERLAKAAKDRRTALQRGSEAELYRFTAELLRETRTGLIAPLISAIDGAQRTLATGEEKQFAALVQQWSTRDVPSHLRAAPNEGLLESESEFPARVDALLAEGFEMGAGGAQKQAVGEIVSGAWASVRPDSPQRGQQTLIDSDTPWWPSKAEARPAEEAASTAKFIVALDVPTVQRRAAEWVRERSPFAEYTQGTLSSWLGDNHADHAERSDRFVDAVRQAVTKCEPLVTVNENVHAKVHENELVDPRIVMGKIPIGSGHEAYQRVLEILEAAGVENPHEHFAPQGSGELVEFSSFLGATVHPVVFTSLMTPIRRDWLQRQGEGKRKTFWSYRRARVLPSFVPVSPARQQALVRGWVTASLLGQVGSVRPPSWSAHPLTIWTPTGEREFPRVLLGPDPVKQASVLPGLLESMILAFVDYANSHYETLEAYMRLIELGTGGVVEVGDPLDYEVVGPELGAWIATGEPTRNAAGTASAPTPPESRAGRADQTPEERRTAILDHLASYHEGYRTSTDSFRLIPETSLTVPRGWEIRDLVLESIETLQTAAGAAQMVDETSDDPDDFEMGD